MEGVQVTVGGKKLLFTTTGQVAEGTGAAQAVKGKWKADSTEGDNKLRYDLGGTAQTPIQAIYGFNDNNQLTVALKGDTASAPFTFPGGIEIDRNHEFQYHVIGSDGDETGANFTLYGEIEFAEETNDLVIHLAGGGDANVQGDSGIQSLEAAKNHIANFNADDLLAYHASTVNEFDGADPIVKPAVLDFVGSWEFKDGTIVFLSQVKSSADKDEVTLAFGGKFKAVTAGFIYHTDGNSTDIALNIRGQHVFRSDRATTQLAWETSIGFSDKRFSAQVHVDSLTKFSNGQLALSGDLKIEHEQGKEMKLELSLEATYSFQAGSLVFKANIVDDGIQTSYDLMLQGNFSYKNLKISFTADFGSAAGVTKVSVTVGIEGNRESMIKNIKLILNITESEAKLQLDLSFEARLRFVDGKRVIEKTASAPALTGNH